MSSAVATIPETVEPTRRRSVRILSAAAGASHAMLCAVVAVAMLELVAMTVSPSMRHPSVAAS